MPPFVTGQKCIDPYAGHRQLKARVPLLVAPVKLNQPGFALNHPELTHHELILATPAQTAGAKTSQSDTSRQSLEMRP
jgi:hypothetical protein